ncbi:MAG: hypothetical protein WA183_14010 [Chthoniobacterales bacterium]
MPPIDAAYNTVPVDVDKVQNTLARLLYIALALEQRRLVNRISMVA